MSAADKPKIDWERIEIDYRAGVKSLRLIAEESTAAGMPVTEGAIRKRAKGSDTRLPWERDLAAKIKAKTDELVRKEAVRAEVRAAYRDTEQATIDANAAMQKDIIMAHRTDITRGRRLAMSLMAELEHQTGNLELYEQLGELLAAPDDKGVDKLNELYRKILATPSRIDSAKKISEMLKNLIALEREAFGIEGQAKTAGDALDKFLNSLDGGSASLLPG